MPRIPVRTSPYHTLPRCTRHYKSKRDLILRALGKASFINGSQFVIAWISPKGEVDSYASELLQSAVNNKDPNAPCVLNRKELDREATRIKTEMLKRWDEVRRLEAQGEAPLMEEDAGDEAGEMEAEDEAVDTIEFDPDSTLVDDAELDLKFLNDPTPSAPVTLSIPSVAIAGPSSSSTSSSIKKTTSASAMMSAFPTTATRASTPGPQLHNISLTPEAVDPYYIARFAALQQATCKLVVKNWIKVIEPKKQMKFPYNKGEDLKPQWWPEGVRHREPDHLSKQERLTLLTSIVRSPLISVSRLELSTAEAGAFISGPRQSILREVYLVAKEEEKKRKENDTDPVINVYLPHLPVSPSAVTPEGGEKRPHAQLEVTVQHDNKENVFQANTNQMLAVPAYGTTQPQKRMKTNASRLPALHLPQHYDPSGFTSPFTFAPQNLNIGTSSQQQPNAWRDGLSAPPPHLSPYPQQEMWGHSAPSSDYSRSPMPELDMNQSSASSSGLHPHPHAHAHVHAQAQHQLHAQQQQQQQQPMQQQQNKYATHLAPILTTGPMNGTPSPGIDSPAFGGQSTATSTQSGYFPRSHTGHSYMQQQQIDYLQQQQQQQQATYDYGSPYLADWDQTYTTA